MRYEKNRVEVLGHSMAYIESGRGDPIVFLHGNPTSSYLWRNIIPYLEKQARCIAPDLLGMGDSQKQFPSGAGTYRFLEHSSYLDAMLEVLGVERNVTFVVHDWGSALGFDWACRHRDAVKGIAYMEAIVRPVTWDEWPESARRFFQRLRSEEGEEMILARNLFIERVLPNSIIRDLTDEEMGEYRKPFVDVGEARRPTLTWPREIPIEGSPAEVHRIVDVYAKWLAQSEVPKLFINADPGSILVGPQREFCRSWPNQTEVTVQGTHYIQEDSPDEIGQAISNWYAGLS
jgi:haloalkane dehalogenase